MARDRRGRGGGKNPGQGQRDSWGRHLHLRNGTHLRTPAISRSTISSSISSLRRSPAGERRRAAFLQSDTPGRRHVRDPIQSRLLEGGNAKFLPAPVAAVAASSVVCCWVFFFFSFPPLTPEFWFLESLGE